MLGDNPIDPVLLSKDLKASREFYAGKLGLEVVEEDDSAITYRCGATHLKVTASETGSKDEQTKASWRVADLRAELDELIARGVQPEEYDTEELKTENGIADRGSAWSGWITDPDGNALGIEQHK